MHAKLKNTISDACPFNLKICQQKFVQSYNFGIISFYEEQKV